MLAVFRAIEQRDAQRLTSLLQPDFALHWPPPLPYGGTARGLDAQTGQDRHTWAATWNPLQPTVAERQMDPRVVAASDQAVVVLWRQRGRSPSGGRFDGPALGLYRVHDGKLARAQMFCKQVLAYGGVVSNGPRPIRQRNIAW